MGTGMLFGKQSIPRLFKTHYQLPIPDIEEMTHAEIVGSTEPFQDQCAFDPSRIPGRMRKECQLLFSREFGGQDVL